MAFLTSVEMPLRVAASCRSPSDQGSSQCAQGPREQVRGVHCQFEEVPDERKTA